MLPAALDATDKAIASAKKNGCRFAKGLSEPMKKAAELGEQARVRIAETPAITEGQAAKAALKAWKDKQPEARTSAKAEWCPAKLKAGAPVDIYFAAEDEAGMTEWLFCDDSRAFAAQGTAPAFEAAAAMKKKPKDKAYLATAAKYPASDIQRAPKAPTKPGELAAGPSPTDGGSVVPVDAGMAADAGS